MLKYNIQIPDLKTCCHILFEMLSSDLRSDCRDLIYWRYIYLENREKDLSMKFLFRQL